MQDNKLKEWYKSSFEAMQGKPVPDVWDGIAAALPSKKYIWLKRSSLLLIPFVLIGVWFSFESHHIDYSPRGFESEISSLYIGADIKEPLQLAMVDPINAKEKTGISVLSSSEINSILTSGGNESQSNQIISGERITPLPTSYLKPGQEEVKQQGEPIVEELNKIDQLDPQIISFTFNPISSELDKPEKIKNRYVGMNVGLYSVTMLNNQFFKAMDKETMSSNSSYIKPTYSVLFGTEIKNNIFLELSASHTNLGQAVSKYEEGVFVKTQESLSYVSFGAGIVKQNPITPKFSTYYGANLEGRFLMKEFSQLSDEFSTRDFAVGAKGGGKFKATKNISIGAGIAINMSVLNTFKGTSKIPKSFNSTRNAFMGIDLSAVYSF
jgi:hypothetical protein